MRTYMRALLCWEGGLSQRPLPAAAEDRVHRDRPVINSTHLVLKQYKIRNYTTRI